ncbi:uncharacterized protein LOC106635780 [Copidosoma floridanum]|uniref:uncharacterized protein LOC106635780 n=1 Tax=Copidosoma floridanum TaxID=29053 RepID=UPI0006C9C638|nr:uncharacterized protein LOC106635780 [Copidosoma floridanum]
MTLFLLLVAVVGVKANPMMNYAHDASTPEPKKDPSIDHYDQRQNGTENYRVKVDGLVFILAPADTLMMGGATIEPNLTSLFSDLNKPKPKPEKENLFLKPLKADKDDVPKSAHVDTSAAAVHHNNRKPGLRISSFIAPFINRIRHAQ